jgi:hypothetical protein
VLAQRAASEGPRWTRAVEDQSAPIPKERTSKLGGVIYIVRRAQLGSFQPPLNTVVSDCASAALLDELFDYPARMGFRAQIVVPQLRIRTSWPAVPSREAQGYMSSSHRRIRDTFHEEHAFVGDFTESPLAGGPNRIIITP